MDRIPRIREKVPTTLQRVHGNSWATATECNNRYYKASSIETGLPVNSNPPPSPHTHTYTLNIFDFSNSAKIISIILENNFQYKTTLRLLAFIFFHSVFTEQFHFFHITIKKLIAYRVIIYIHSDRPVHYLLQYQRRTCLNHNFLSTCNKTAYVTVYCIRQTKTNT